VTEDLYVYPGTRVLRNKFGITSAAILDQIGNKLVSQRVVEGVPKGDFDLVHLRAIH
jgi:cell filamentation protein